MEREIEFRAINHAGYFEYGDYYRQNGIHLVNDEIINFNTLGEYTGLKDKNKVKIYEGDILKHYPGMFCQWGIRYSQVIYRDCSFWEDHESISFILNDRDQILEVIGNIFQNNELLKLIK